MVDRLREEMGEAVRVDWQAFELRPEPVPTLPPRGEYLTRVWESSVYPMARERGMTLRLPPVQPRTRLAFQAVEHARTAGAFDPYHRALFRAFFEEGEDIGRPEVLGDLATEAGLAADDLLVALELETHLPAVLAQEARAADLGLRGVPAILLGDDLETAERVTGAVPYEVLAREVETALETRR